MIRLRRGMALNTGLGIAALALYAAPIPKLARLHPHGAPHLAMVTLPNAPPPDDMQALISRPVFSATRHPPAPPAAPAAPGAATAKPAPSTSGMVLLGIVHAGTRAVALVTLPGALHPQQITLGAALGDWTVTEILNDRIELKSGSTHAALIFPQHASSNLSPSTTPMPPQAFPQFPPFPSPAHRSP